MDRSALSRIASKIAADPPYQGTEVTAMPKQNKQVFQAESGGDFPYKLDIVVDHDDPNGGLEVKGQINGVEVHGSVETPDDGGWEYIPAGEADELDEDATEILLTACGEAVEEAGGTTPG